MWSVKYELWRMNCEVWTLKSFVSLYMSRLMTKPTKWHGCPATWLVLSWCGSYIFNHFRKLGSVKCELWSMNCELWSVKSELWTMKSPPVFRSFVLNSLWTFVKDIWQDKRLQNPWLRLPNCSWSKLFEPYFFFFFFFELNVNTASSNCCHKNVYQATFPYFW